jgi:hypothetical protein
LRCRNGHHCAAASAGPHAKITAHYRSRD